MTHDAVRASGAGLPDRIARTRSAMLVARSAAQYEFAESLRVRLFGLQNRAALARYNDRRRPA